MSARISRRNAAGGVAMLVLGASAYEIATPDERLLSLAAQFQHRQRSIDPLMERFFQTPPDNPDIEAIGAAETAMVERQDDIADQMKTIQAVTSAGIQAKAVVARQLFLRHHKDALSGGFADEEIAFAWSLINDTLGRAV